MPLFGNHTTAPDYGDRHNTAIVSSGISKAALNGIKKAARNGSLQGVVSSPSSAITASNLDSFYAGENNYLDILKAISAENNAFNLEQTKMVNDFNANEAEKNRNWQEMLSNSAHQREVKDLIAAGLNPVLSAGGQGAVVGSGAAASGQKAVADSIYGNGVMQAMTAAINAASAARVAQINAAAKISAAGISSSASRYATDKNYDAQIKYQNVITNNSLLKDITDLAKTFIQIAK